jgi:hypothetical protein
MGRDAAQTEDGRDRLLVEAVTDYLRLRVVHLPPQIFRHGPVLARKSSSHRPIQGWGLELGIRVTSNGNSKWMTRRDPDLAARPKLGER